MGWKHIARDWTKAPDVQASLEKQKQCEKLSQYPPKYQSHSNSPQWQQNKTIPPKHSPHSNSPQWQDKIQDTEFNKTIINLFREFTEDMNKHMYELREAEIY